MKSKIIYNGEEFEIELTKEQEEQLNKKKQLIVPEQLEIKNFAALISLCQEEINVLKRKGFRDADIQHYIYEAAMEAVFGNEVWEYINSKN